ncbi:glycoside hydrolase family 88 protein [Salegentibacter sp. LM13S]|uniref:glycoside hydrolase family 88/105 protein n=1 Tax=Salegentibacter lacus TaxID=2873599 RepID=UPI001CCB47E3|nr:glycoside hydrolase family 88 protein [Salegentibacter lacus]MBZ9630960.1 glycoside hydrolase family 88 protein [Salegentibacter lacus]
MAPAYGQENEKMTDSNTPLHLIKPGYPIPYGEVSKSSITSDLEKIHSYLDRVTPFELKDQNGQLVRAKKADENSEWEKGDFRLFSYEWGVTYAGMLSASEATGDPKFKEYTFNRLAALAEVSPTYAKQYKKDPTAKTPIKSVIHPEALDDAGSISWAMIKADHAGLDSSLDEMINNFSEFIMKEQYRLQDGTFARKRPVHNTVWLDDLFMSVPALARMGKKTGDDRYFDEAVKQVLLFAEKMYNSQKNIFMHGWVQGTETYPQFHWARANGWAIMAIVELLDVLPKDHTGRAEVLKLFKDHSVGLVKYQSGKGFWHQLVDKNDSYLETSATAIFTYAFAKGINKGWLDHRVFGPVTLLGWSAVSTQINDTGQVEGTCVGTGMAFDPAFYYYRPQSPYAAHGYGPTILAGAEVIKLLDHYEYEIEETAVQFFD